MISTIVTPPVTRTWVPTRQPSLPKNLLPQRAWRVLLLHQAALLEDGDYGFYEVYEGAGGYGVDEVEAIYSGFLPVF